MAIRFIALLSIAFLCSGYSWPQYHTNPNAFTSTWNPSMGGAYPSSNVSDIMVGTRSVALIELDDEIALVVTHGEIYDNQDYTRMLTKPKRQTTHTADQWGNSEIITDKPLRDLSLFRSSFGGGNLELFGVRDNPNTDKDDVVHFWRDQWGWHEAGVITSQYNVSGLDCIQGAMHKGRRGHQNFDCVIVHDGTLQHFWRDSSQGSLPWYEGAIIARAMFDSVQMIQASNGNFELLVSEFGEGQLIHYYRGNNERGLPWRKLGVVFTENNGAYFSFDFVESKDGNLDAVVVRDYSRMRGLELRENLIEAGNKEFDYTPGGFIQHFRRVDTFTWEALDYIYVTDSDVDHLYEVSLIQDSDGTYHMVNIYNYD